MNESYTFQVDELKKLGYGFFEKLAFAGDELTYTFADTADTDAAKQIQVEISAKLSPDPQGVLVTFDFCPNNGKWMHSSDTITTYLVSQDNSWHLQS